MSHDLVSLSGNIGLIDELWHDLQRDASAIDPSWRALFESGQIPPGSSARGGLAFAAVGSIALDPLISAFRIRGHFAAKLDPLEMLERPPSDELLPATYGIGAEDLSAEIELPSVGGLGGAVTIAELEAHLRRVYCGSIGLEFMHISTPKKKEWLAQRMESRFETSVPSDIVRREMLEQLVMAEEFERFIHTKFPGTKRFSLEGGESLIPLLEQVLDNAGRLGAIEAVLGMAHRGRLNVLTQTVRRAARDLFSEFEDIEPESTLGGGDVKYHLGYSTDRTDRAGNHLHLSLSFNPSHLEAVDPVVCGRVRAKQRRHADWERRRVVGILIHGDAAFAGQGLVSETLQLSNLSGYRTGGTVHVIVNNQIGFTASPRESRSTPYCTDVAQMIGCPIWHVNGEDLDAVARVVAMAMDYRQEFQSDVVIDMFCYRKFGHNEMDEPSFTQPIMYKRIKDKEPIDVIYGRRLLEAGILSEAEIEAIHEKCRAALQVELDAGRAAERRPRIAAMQGLWSPYRGGDDADCEDVDTGVPLEKLASVGRPLTCAPQNLTLHPKILRLLETRREMASGERPIDWGMGELLAYASLLAEGTNVRLSGQDSGRGTFSHRHAMVTDIETGSEYLALNDIEPNQGECRILDSPLSEAGVLGFEFGYSLDYPDALVIWEAQFGDFANGAQVIIDQFISASEDKWKRLSGLVMFLPHGYEGQGPEHSSARLERYLQSCAEDNMQVAQPTTPAQMFHLLRRQVRRPYRKPLVVMTPKSLLRKPEAGSSLDELSKGRFRRLIVDDAPDPAAVRRILVSTGRVYYDLAARASERGSGAFGLVRVEQLYPLANSDLEAAFAVFPNAEEIVWVQDEPENMGASQFMLPRLVVASGEKKVWSVTRRESASPATGSHRAHAIEQEELLDSAFATQG